MQVHNGALPISCGSTLAWLGFSEECLLTTYDSEVSKPNVFLCVLMCAITLLAGRMLALQASLHMSCVQTVLVLQLAQTG